MSNLTLINVSLWSPVQVSNWLKGLDDAIQPCVDNFVNQEITGKKLLVLDHQDLDKLGVEKLGHQELILEAVDLLCHIQYSLENETIQSLALKLVCQAKCVCNDIKVHEKLQDDKLPVEVLSGIASAMGHVKSLVSWFDRAPFDGSDEYIKTRQSLVKLGMDIISAVQGDHVFDNTETVKAACQELSNISEQLIQNSKDTLTIQPAWLETATIRKKPEEELGMHIQSSYNGTHTIGGIKEESPALHCGKVEEGDEVIMVNYQVVIGWQLKKLVNSLKENKKEVILTLKKRPCHVDPFGNKAQKKKRGGNKLQPGTYPLKGNRSRRSRKSRRTPLQLPITAEQNAEALSDSMKEVESENDALDDNDNVFRSGSESPGFQHLRTFDDVKQRRATVSGGSPTVARPSIMISDSDTPRPKSYTLALTSPGSEDFSSYSFDLNSLDLGSPASEMTTSPPTDSSETGSKVLSPPPFGNYTNMLKNGGGSPKSPGNLPHKGEHVKFKTEITISPLCREDSPQKTVSKHSVEEAEKSAEDSVEKMECDTDISVRASENTISNRNKASENSPPHKNDTKNHPPITSPDYKSTTCNIGNSQTYEPSTIGTSSDSGRKLETVATSIASHNQICTTGNQKTEASSSCSGTVVMGRDMKTPSPAKSDSSVGSNSSKEKGKKEMMGSETPIFRKGADQAIKTIAGAAEDLESPTLLNFRRIDSQYRAEQAEKERRHREGTKVSPRGKTLSSVEEEDRPQRESLFRPCIVASYTVNIVGGVPQKVTSPPLTSPAMAQGKKEPAPAPPSILRHKRRPGNRSGPVNRRISCKDLGQGDCQGWLLKKKSSRANILSKWQKRWFILNKQNLYYYKDPNDDKAMGVIHLPGFQVSPAPEIKTSKYAFKAHHTGTTFHFASDREEDRGKWMNKMGLAAIEYTSDKFTMTAGFVKPAALESVIVNAGYYSESDDEDDVSITDAGRHSPSPSQITEASSTDDLLKLHESIMRQDMHFDGTDSKVKRIRRITRSEDLELTNPEELEKRRKLASLDRTLKIKEQELEAIVKLLDNSDLNADSLKTFKDAHPEVVGSINEDTQASALSLTSEDELQP